MHNPAPATLSQGQRQQSAIQLQKHVSQGNTPAQELQGPEPLGNGEGELSPDDMQLTDDTATPDMPAEVETAADAGAGAEAAAVLETPVAHSDAGQVPESQPVAQGRCCDPESHLLGLMVMMLDQLLIGHIQYTSQHVLICTCFECP